MLHFTYVALATLCCERWRSRFANLAVYHGNTYLPAR